MPVFLVFLILFFVLPLLMILSVRSWRDEMIRHPRTIFWSFAFVYTVGWLWDWLSVRTGLWYYDSAPTIGIWIGAIPIEEFVGFYIFGTLFIVSVIFITQRILR